MTRPSARFLSQLAHDLRSPLNVLGSSLTELAHEPPLPPADRAQVLSLAQRSVNRLLTLSDRLSLAARLEAPFDLKLETVDLVQLTRDTVAAFATHQLRRRVEVVTAFPQEPLSVAGDRALLTTVLLELLTNGNRLAHRGLRVAVSKAEGAVVCVEDDGAGVKEDERGLLFEPFAERRSHTGLGIGLWLARRVAELHGGTVTVESLTPGTRQRLTLPCSS